jgi:hypothetical protein
MRPIQFHAAQKEIRQEFQCVANAVLLLTEYSPMEDSKNPMPSWLVAVE